MLFRLKASLGDHALYTGIPEAFYQLTGEKLNVISQYIELWQNNPFVDLNAPGPEYELRLASSENDWQEYPPARVFRELTGKTIASEKVSPNMYYPRMPVENHIVVNVQAGWPSRRGYAHFRSLVESLMSMEYVITLVHASGYRDCFGDASPVTVPYDSFVESPTLERVIRILQSAAFYIGYDSGYAQIAAALKIPYVVLLGATPFTIVAHPSCIYHLEICEHCHTESCAKRCLENAPNKNDEIIKAIKSYRG
jgi:ADP-heptose:LPS heptosyltransferase